MVSMKDVGPVLSGAEIAALETRIGMSLPESYRAFLLRSNGGKPVPKYFDVPNWYEPGSLVNNFWGILPGAYNDLEENMALFKGRFPPGFISIARDPGGNLVLISLNGATRGKVYFWDHEEEPDEYTDQLEDYPNIYLLADSFEAFLNQLRDEDEPGTSDLGNS